MRLSQALNASIDVFSFLSAATAGGMDTIKPAWLLTLLNAYTVHTVELLNEVTDDSEFSHQRPTKIETYISIRR